MRRRVDTPPYRIFAILGVLILGLAGCSEKTDEKPTAPVAPAKVPAERSAPATNKVSLAEVFPGATTNELAHIQACQDAIDDGRDALAQTAMPIDERKKASVSSSKPRRSMARMRR